MRAHPGRWGGFPPPSGSSSGLAGFRRHSGGVPAVDDPRIECVERLDRVHVGERLERLHEEDFLSAMGLDPRLKYEAPHVQRVVPAGGFADRSATTATPGPSLRAMADLLARYVGRVGVLPFLEAVTFNVAIGNADSHARNYSVLLPSSGQVERTPLYDLICTRLYPELDVDAAQPGQREKELDAVEAADLVAEAATWALPATVAERRVRGLLLAVAEALGDLRSART